MITSLRILLKIRNISRESCTENQNTHFMFHNFFSENHTLCEIMWKIFVEPDRPYMITRRMLFACWITKTTQTHTQHMQYFLLFHGNNDLAKASQCYFTLLLFRKLGSIPPTTWCHNTWIRCYSGHVTDESPETRQAKRNWERKTKWQTSVQYKGIKCLRSWRRTWRGMNLFLSLSVFILSY
jgi:hypothetical protein